MKNVFFLLIALVSFFNVKSQNPVTWQATYKSISASEGEVIIVATIEKGWHTYSQKETDAGPINTIIKFTPSKEYTLVGKTEESNAHEEFDKAFDAKLFIFKDKAEFKQKVKLTGKAATINVKVESVCCNDNMCMPPKAVDLVVKAQ
jgi:hypothetical protein